MSGSEPLGGRRFDALRRRAAGLGRAVRLVWDGAPGWSAASVVLFAVQGILPPLALYLVKLLIDAVARELGGASDPRTAFREIESLIVAAAAVALAGTFCTLLGRLFREIQAQAVTDHVFRLLHAKSITIDLPYYEDAAYHDTLHRAQREAPHLPARVVGRFAELLRNGLALIALGGLLIALHWGVALVLILAVAPAILVRLRYSDKIYRWSRGKTPTERRAWYYHWLLTWDEHAKEIRLFGLGDLFRRRFDRLRARILDEKIALAAHRTGGELVAQSISTVLIFATYAFLAQRALAGGITLGDLVLYYQAFQRGQSFLQGTMGAFAGLYDDHLFLQNLYDFLDLERRIPEPEHPKPVPPLERGLALEGVSFQYGAGDRKVLDGLDLELTAGQVLALVGENGAGKSTLVKLLCRLYDPTAGRITWDGVDLRDMSGALLRRKISVVFQDFARYQLSAKENIWFGDTELDPDDHRVRDAARQVGLDDAIADLPQGWENMLGKWFEDGRDLSLGQWQKVAIARAFLRQEARLVILDEPTSGLDARAEEALLLDFRRLLAGRTGVVISHRLSAARLADRIAVLDDGRLVELGSHDELLARGGLYAHLFELQSRRYRDDAANSSGAPAGSTSSIVR